MINIESENHHNFMRLIDTNEQKKRWNKKRNHEKEEKEEEDARCFFSVNLLREFRIF